MSSKVLSIKTALAMNGLGVSLLSMKPADNKTYDGGRVVPIKLADAIPPTRIGIASHAEAPENLLADRFTVICQNLFADRHNP
ncbi:hypothetical protein [Roseobacter sp. EG26]|uniref:hypothetical protein n=1 Tax=Roseobacter sp. EG26 TaxID=3412477 RepID=UPI003CE486E2